MTTEELDHPVKTDPAEALEKHSAELTPKQLWGSIPESIVAALIFHAEKLPKEQLDFCVRKHPDFALLHARDQLSQEQLEFCITKEPRRGLQCVTHLLSDDQIVVCANNCEESLNNFLKIKKNPSPIMLAALSKVMTRLYPTTQQALAMALAKTI